MKFNIANKTDNEINSIIEAYATTEQAEMMGFRDLLPTIEGGVLELIGVGYVVTEEETFNHEKNAIGQALRVMTDSRIAYLNHFPA